MEQNTFDEIQEEPQKVSLGGLLDELDVDKEMEKLVKLRIRQSLSFPSRQGMILITERPEILYSLVSTIMFRFCYRKLQRCPNLSIWFIVQNEVCSQIRIGDLSEYPDKETLQNIKMKYIHNSRELVDFLSKLILTENNPFVVINGLSSFRGYKVKLGVKAISLLKTITSNYLVSDLSKFVSVHKCLREDTVSVIEGVRNLYRLSVTCTKGKTDDFKRSAEIEYIPKERVLVVKKFDFVELEMFKRRGERTPIVSEVNDTTMDDQVDQ